MRRIFTILLISLILCNINPSYIHGIEEKNDRVNEISNYIENNFDKLDVPGLSIGIIKDGEINYLNFGYSNLEEKIPTTNNTNFEVGSITKSFTALSILKLEEEGKLSLKENVSKYFPNFFVLYDGNKYDITIEQLLNQTSGIGEKSINLIRENPDDDALEQLVNKIKGIQLTSRPGTHFAYTSINYDILGAVIEKVTGNKYEEYIYSNILLPLDMDNSYIGAKRLDKDLAIGYKISYFTPREYQPPIFRNNYPAGYLVSNTEDMMKWLKVQLRITNSDLSNLAVNTQEPNKNVSSKNNMFYGNGWYITTNRFDEINHSGSNPNFSSYISFSKQKNMGIVILGNSNSENFFELATYITSFLYGDPLLELVNSSSKIDTILSILSFIFFILCLLLVFYSGFIIYRTILGHRYIEFKKLKKRKLFVFLAFLIPILYGIYLFPEAFAGIDWYNAIVWGPASFKFFMISILCLLGLVYIVYILLSCFPSKNIYLKDAPEILTLGVISGLCNTLIIVLVTTAINGYSENKFLIYYFILFLIIYIIGRRTLEVKLVDITQSIIKSLREKVFDKLFKTKYEDFEKMESGKIITTITDDINRIGDLAGFAVMIVTSLITIISAFIYLGTISKSATLVTILIVVILVAIYSIFDGRASSYFNVARETQNKLMAKVESFIIGFKDLSLHKAKRYEYKDELIKVNSEYKLNNVNAFKMFINAFMFGESLFIIVLGFIVFSYSSIFNHISLVELTTFVMILLYILGPINTILNALPQIAQIRVAIDRVKSLLYQFPEVAEEENVELEIRYKIKKLTVNNLTFEYSDNGIGFKIGPINFNVNEGEVLFIIGGNGSGKTTLIKLITGLYRPNSGKIKINDKEINVQSISEQISAVFSDSFLFERIYNTDLINEDKTIGDYLKLLELDSAVKVEGNYFSTTLLSTGQKKRMHLLRCYLEGKPIFIFDELAADQDPHFRKIFYRELIPRMKAEGKIVIAVTHDDQYFDVADKIFKVDMGKMVTYH